MNSSPITKQYTEQPKASYSQVVSSKKLDAKDSLPITKQSIEKPKASYSQVVSSKKVYVMDSLPITKQSIEKPKASYSQVVSSKKIYVMDSLPITKQSIEKPKASYSQVVSSNIRQNHDKTELTPRNSTFNSTSVRATLTTHTPTYLSKPEESKFIPRNSKLGSASMQATRKGKNYKPWINPEISAKHASNPQLHSKNTQDNIPNSSSITPRNLQPLSPRFSRKTPQKILDTGNSVKSFIEQVTKLYSLNNKDINKKTVLAFNTFNKNVTFLTDDHRKQLLSIIPTISELIEKRNLDNITIVTILYSLSKIGVCNKLNINNTPENKCIQHEQTCKNLINKIFIKLLAYKIHQQRDWSNIFYSIGLLVEQSPSLITTENINKLLVNFYIQKQSLTNLTPQHISNIFLSVVKLLKFNKLNSEPITTYYFIEYLLGQIKFSVSKFSPQHISNIIHSIAKLSDFTEFRQLVSENKNVIALLLQDVTTNKNLILNCIEIGSTIYGLGELAVNIYFSNALANLTRSTYDFLLEKISPIALEFNIITSNSILNGIIKLISSNIIIYNKPSIHLIRDIYLNKAIANPEIINRKDQYQLIYTMAFFQEYLTKIELVKILKNINFFTPDINNLKTYFTSMGYLLVKIRKELDNDNKNEHLLALERKVTTEIKKVWLHFQPDIESFNEENRSAIHNTCSLIYKAEDLTLLKASYSDGIYSSKLEKNCLAIIKTLIPTPESLKLEYRINSLPPVDACIINPDGSMIAIEIQGSGHYLDNEGKHPTGSSLLKIARLEKENIKVIEVNGTKTMNYNSKEELATYFDKSFISKQCSDTKRIF